MRSACARCMVFFLAWLASSSAGGEDAAKGIVYEDTNANSERDAGERGLPDVLVSNGRDIAVTDAGGRWQLPSGDDVIFFVIKPAGYAVPLDPYRRPQFFYIHKPAGSPPDAVPGVPSTGPLPASIDFALIPRPGRQRRLRPSSARTRRRAVSPKRITSRGMSYPSLSASTPRSVSPLAIL